MRAALGRIEERWTALAGNVRGAVWITASALFGAGTGATAKYLTQDIHPFEVVFFRIFFGAFVILPFVLHGGAVSWRTGNFGMQFARAVISTAGLVCWIVAVQQNPLATATALSFSKPLFQIFLAILFLNEVVRWRRGSATAIGFLGVLIVLRPGSGDFAVEALWAVAAALFFAVTQTIVKRLAARERAETITLYFSLIGAPLMLPLAIWVWTMPTLEQWLLLGLVAVLATAGQSCWIQGLRAGEVTAVGPFEYTQLIWAGLLGFFLFDELPGVWAWVGAAVIVFSTLYMAHREAQLGRLPR